MILAFLLQSRPQKQSRGGLLSTPGRDHVDPLDPSFQSPPLPPQQQLRTWTATDIPAKIDVTVTLEALHMWPIVFTRIMQLLGRSYRFVVTRSTEAQKYLSASDVAADVATEALWMTTYSELNRDRLEHAVYTLIHAAWDYQPLQALPLRMPMYRTTSRSTWSCRLRQTWTWTCSSGGRPRTARAAFHSWRR